MRPPPTSADIDGKVGCCWVVFSTDFLGFAACKKTLLFRRLLRTGRSTLLLLIVRKNNLLLLSIFLDKGSLRWSGAPEERSGVLPAEAGGAAGQGEGHQPVTGGPHAVSKGTLCR